MLTSAAGRTLRSALTATLALAAAAAPLLAPGQAQAASELVSDNFDRTVSAGWGAAGTGGAWTTGGAGSVSVSGGAGQVRDLPRGRSFRASLERVSLRDVEVSARFQVSTGKDVQYGVETRRQPDGSAYVARLRVDAQGRTQLELMRSRAGALDYLKGSSRGLGRVAGTPLVLSLSTTATSPVIVQARVSRADATGPGWQLTALDSGSKALTRAGATGLSLYNGPANGAVDVATSSFSAVRATTGSDLLTETPGTSAGTTPAVAVRHGAEPVGSARYPVPANALFVSPAGSDAHPGTEARPLRTVTAAVGRVRPGQTVVLRAGTYHESVVVPPGRATTVQPYPGEKVWFDGTRPVTGFQRSGGDWEARWTVRFDASPTYTKGAPDGTKPGWQFVNPKYPMAAHPDMVWLAGRELKQVRTRALVKPGTFYVDRGRGRLVLGSKPSGTGVRAAALQSAFSLRAPGTVLRGFGVRRYAPSVWQQGMITSYYPGMTVDNLTLLDSATGGIGFYKPDSVIKNTTVDGSGHLGIQANHADNLVMDNVSVTDSNDERFNPGPAAGGIKITGTRGLTLRNSEILRSNGNAFWADQSCYDITVANNEITGGSRYGVFLEISSTATVTNNVIADNAYDGVMITNTDRVQVWNNTVVGNRRAIAVVQDSRRIEQLQVAGHDPRRPQPDLSMPWVIGRSSIGNNVLAAGRDATAVLAVESYQQAFDADDLDITANGNVYAQTALGAPNAAVVWARRGAQPQQFVLLEDFRSGSGQERAGLHAVLASPVDAAYRVRGLVSATSDTVAQPLPADVAGAAGRAAGTKWLGAWDRAAR